MEAIANLRVLDPLGYLEFLRLMEGTAVVVIDSGGIQEETTFLGLLWLTLRKNTGRPVTIDMNTNELTTHNSHVFRLRERVITHEPADAVVDKVERACSHEDRRRPARKRHPSSMPRR